MISHRAWNALDRLRDISSKELNELFTQDEIEMLSRRSKEAKRKFPHHFNPKRYGGYCWLGDGHEYGKWLEQTQPLVDGLERLTAKRLGEEP